MPLRIRIFLWISLLFVLTIFAIFLVSEIEVKHQLGKARKEIEKEIKELEDLDRQDILTFLSLEVDNIKQKIFSLFDHIHEIGELTKRYLPTAFNIRTKNWASLGVLLASHPWIDFTQVVIDGELTAGYALRSPFTRKFIRIPISDDISLFVTGHADSSYTTYIGVPFWSNRILIKEGLLPKVTNPFFNYSQDQWLLFSYDQLMRQDPKNLVTLNTNMNFYLFDPTVNIHSTQELNLLIDMTVHMVEQIQEQVKANDKLRHLFEHQDELNRFIYEKIQDPAEPSQFVSDTCQTQLCKVLKSRLTKETWGSLRYWGNRTDEIRLVWEMSMVSGAGLWHFDPYSPNAPLGIVAYSWENEEDFMSGKSYVGRGMLVRDAFLMEPIETERRCVIQDGLENTNIRMCANTNLSFVTDEKLGGIFLCGNEFFEIQNAPMKKTTKSSLTIGVSIEDMLHELALASPNDVLLVSNDGIIRLYKTGGDVKDLTHDFHLSVKDLIAQKTGKIKNIDGEEYFFVHLTSLTTDDGHVLIIERKEGEQLLLNKLHGKAKVIMHNISIDSAALAIIALLIILTVLNTVLQKITNPIGILAKQTKKIGEGKFSEVDIPEQMKERNDEVGTLCNAFSSMTVNLERGEEVRGILDKVVSKEIAEQILKDGVKLGGEVRNISIMFADIRNFTKTTELMDPTDVLAMLNDCLTLLSRVIEDFGGVIDKYEGDEVMALFGAPVETQHHALQAVLCGLEMQEAMTEWNEHRDRNGLCRLELGIGIHSGLTVVGNVGAENRLSYTCLGHTVNLASRVSDQAKPHQLLISEDTYNQPFVKDNIRAKPLPPIQFKGVSVPVNLFEAKKPPK